MCGPSKGEVANAAQQATFADDMVSQAKALFGKDDEIFNTMHDSYSKMIAGGPSQHGFSEGERSALRSATITNASNAARFAGSAMKAGQAGYGGGNQVSMSGTTVGQNLAQANESAARTAEGLNQVDRADYATGRDNYFKAAAGMESLPGVYNNTVAANQTAMSGMNTKMMNTKSIDAAKGWWKKPVMGLVMGAANLATGGLSGMASSAMKGFMGGGGGGGGFNFQAPEVGTSGQGFDFQAPELN